MSDYPATETLNRQEFGQQVLERAFWRPTPEDLGQWSAAYRALFWRPFLGRAAYDVYDALVAAIIAGMEINASTLLACSGRKSRRALAPALARLEDELLVLNHIVGKGKQTRYLFDVLPRLPALAPAQAKTLSRPLQTMNLHFLGSLPGFDLPAWHKRPESSFVPLTLNNVQWRRAKA